MRALVGSAGDDLAGALLPFAPAAAAGPMLLVIARRSLRGCARRRRAPPHLALLVGFVAMTSPDVNPRLSVAPPCGRPASPRIPCAEGGSALEIFVDGDACPVKDEVYVVATRYGVPVVVVANARMFVPEELGVELVVVEAGADAADDWIADQVRPGDVVVTADIPLAARCLEAGAHVVGPQGRAFTEDSIGELRATRDLKERLRGAGVATGGPSPLADRDRSRFLSRLDQIVQRGLREGDGGG